MFNQLAVFVEYELPIERETQEINELFAKAHEEMDNIQKLFACCESMACYGFQRDGQSIAERLIFELYTKPPKLVFDVSSRSPKHQPDSMNIIGQKVSKNVIMEQDKNSTIASSPNMWHRRSLPSSLIPPSREELNTCKKIIINLKRTLFCVEVFVERHADVSSEHHEDIRLWEPDVQIQRRESCSEVGHQNTAQSPITSSDKANGSSDIDFGECLTVVCSNSKL